jgi:hypothetical protein
MIRRRLLHAALTVLPALAFSGAALAQHVPPSNQAQQAAPAGSLSTEDLQDIPGPEYATANRLKNEALHGLLMGTDHPAATEAKMKAFAAEYSRVAGSDPATMEAHVLQVGAQLSAMMKDPQFQAHLAQLHASH